jgi:phosphate transport system protein
MVDQRSGLVAMINVSLEQLISQLRQDTLRMGALVESAVSQAFQALFQQNLALADQVIKQDDRIDFLYRKLEQDCLTMLAFHTPMARDLRYIGTVLQLSRDLERIGDYAVDICEDLPRLLLYPPLPEMTHVELMGQRCQNMLTRSLTAFTELDPLMGKILMKDDDEVDSDYEVLYQCLAQQHAGAQSVEPLLLVLLIIRYLERIADHSTNIALRVAFIVTGVR